MITNKTGTSFDGRNVPSIGNTRQRRAASHSIWDQAMISNCCCISAINRKTPGHGYRASSGSRLSFQGRWYVCPGLLSRLAGREFEVYFDRRDISVLYLFMDGIYLGEAYCTQLMGGRESRMGSQSHAKIRRGAGSAGADARATNSRTHGGTKQGMDANAETQRFVKWNVDVSGTVNERRSIQQKSSNA